MSLVITYIIHVTNLLSLCLMNIDKSRKKYTHYEKLNLLFDVHSRTLEFYFRDI